MLQAMKSLSKDLISIKTDSNRAHLFNDILSHFSDDRGVPKGRMLQFYGLPDCGKTLIAKDLVEMNPYRTFVYISGNPDDISKMNYKNVVALKSNVFEDTLDFVDRSDKHDIDIIIVDNINNMLSREELRSAFTRQLDEHELFRRYIKRLSKLAAMKNCLIVIMNSINSISNKSRYGNMLEKECIASFRITKLGLTSESLCIEIKPSRNMLAQNKNDSRRFLLDLKKKRGRW